MNWSENKRIKSGWKRLAIAILRQACKDLGTKYLETEHAEFLMTMSDTEKKDYKFWCDYHDRNLAYAIKYYKDKVRMSNNYDNEFKQEIIKNNKKKC